MPEAAFFRCPEMMIDSSCLRPTCFNPRVLVHVLPDGAVVIREEQDWTFEYEAHVARFDGKN